MEFFGTAEDLKGNDLNWMAGGVFGIYGNTAAEALYPSFTNDSAGAPLTGANNYTYQVRARSAAACERLLVAHHVRAAARACWSPTR